MGMMGGGKKEKEPIKHAEVPDVKLGQPVTQAPDPGSALGEAEKLADNPPRDSLQSRRAHRNKRQP